MSFRVRLTREAEADLERSFDFVLERELAGEAGGDLELAEQALFAIHAGFHTLQTSPFTCRKAGTSPFLRELIIAFGRSAARATWRCSRLSAAPRWWWLRCATRWNRTITER